MQSALSRPAGPILLLLASASAPGAQNPLDGSPRSVPWTASAAGQAQVTRCEGADLTDDRIPEFIALDGDRVVVTAGFGYYRSKQQEVVGLAPATDFDIAPGIGTSGASAVIAATSAGIYQLDYEPDSALPFLDAQLVVSNSDWNNLQRVLVGLVDSTQLGMVGLAQDGKTIRFCDELLTGSTDATQTLPTPALDLVLMDLNGVGNREVVAICANGLYVVSHGGVLLAWPFATPIDAAHLTTFRQAGYTEDRLAALMGTGSGSATDWILHAIDSTGVEDAVPMGASDLHGICAGDVDNDGSDDLVIANRVQWSTAGVRPQLLINQIGSPASSIDSFELPSSYSLDFETGLNATSSQEAQPVLVDAYRDGDLDLALFLDSSSNSAAANQLLLLGNTSNDRRAQRIKIKSDGSGADIQATQLQWSDGGSPPQLSRPVFYLHFTTDQTLGLTGANGIELRVWKEDGNGRIDPNEHFQHRYLPFSDDGVTTLTATADVNNFFFDPAIAPMLEGETFFYEYAQARFNLDASGNVIEVVELGPLHSFSASFDPVQHTDLLDGYGLTPSTDVRTVTRTLPAGYSTVSIPELETMGGPSNYFSGGSSSNAGQDPFDDPPGTSDDDPPRNDPPASP